MFKNTIRLSPVAIGGLTTAHPSTLAYRDWWKEQIDRCINGYKAAGIEITGDHYWYLNFWKIKGVNPKTGRKDLIAPRFLDLDYEFFHELEKARKAGQDMCIVKRRQVGFSEKLASLVGKEFTLFPHSQSVIVAGEEKYTNNTMRMVRRGLASLKGTEFFKRKLPDQPDYVQAKYKTIEDGIPVERGTMSEIFALTAKNNPQVTAGLSPSLIIFEEAGRFIGVKDTYNYVKPSLEANFKKTGLAIIVGTGGEMEGGVEELEEVFYNPEAWGMRGYDRQEENFTGKTCYFVPAWKYSVIDVDGNSLHDPSVEQILKNRENARKSKDPKKFVTELTQMPLSPEEAFMRTGGNRFNIAKLNARLAFLKTHRELDMMEERGRLEWIRDDKNNISGVEWFADPNGPVRIYEHPKKDAHGNVLLNLYKGSTDSYDKDEANSSTSKLSCQIFKGFYNADQVAKIFVARYTERPKTAEEAWEYSAKLCMYYMAPNLIEWSNIGIFGWYERVGLAHFLRERPRVAYANVKESRVNNRFGIDPSTKDSWITAYRDYIETHIDNMYDQEQILAAIRYREEKGYNCDITVSSALAIIHDLDDTNLQVKEKGNDKVVQFFHYSSKGGRMVQSYTKSQPVKRTA